MRNLAGDPRCDESIHDELQAAGIEIVTADEPRCSEVAARLTGRLGPFTFARAWYYWVVEGPTPLAVARRLYEHPIGRKDVRVAGHCMCPWPESWARYMSASGKKLITPKSAGHPRPADNGSIMAEIDAKIDAECEIVDDPAAAAVAAFVDCYHIDSAAGLRLFADTVAP